MKVSPESTETATSRIAALRIHVKRARLRTSKFIPNNMNKITDQIFTYIVCHATFRHHYTLNKYHHYNHNNYVKLAVYKITNRKEVNMNSVNSCDSHLTLYLVVIFVLLFEFWVVVG